MTKFEDIKKKIPSAGQLKDKVPSAGQLKNNLPSADKLKQQLPSLDNETAQKHLRNVKEKSRVAYRKVVGWLQKSTKEAREQINQGQVPQQALLLGALAVYIVWQTVLAYIWKSTSRSGRSFITNFLTFIWPALSTYKLLDLMGTDNSQATQWHNFWVVYALFTLLDSLLYYTPLYFGFKVVVLAWAQAPGAHGGAFLFDRVLNIDTLLAKFPKLRDPEKKLKEHGIPPYAVRLVFTALLLGGGAVLFGSGVKLVWLVERVINRRGLRVQHMLASLVTIGYPLLATAKFLAGRDKEKGKGPVSSQWLAYWVIFFGLQTVDPLLAPWLFHYVPIQTAFLVWCMLPQTRGAHLLVTWLAHDSRFSTAGSSGTRPASPRSPPHVIPDDEDQGPEKAQGGKQQPQFREGDQVTYTGPTGLAYKGTVLGSSGGLYRIEYVSDATEKDIKRAGAEPVSTGSDVIFRDDEGKEVKAFVLGVGDEGAPFRVKVIQEGVESSSLNKA